uniref:Uncharacterized protein n=1 Tax=Arundo donax TaxID=35708 RepID=A0A0A9H026_ARUDO
MWANVWVIQPNRILVRFEDTDPSATYSGAWAPAKLGSPEREGGARVVR